MIAEARIANRKADSCISAWPSPPRAEAGSCGFGTTGGHYHKTWDSNNWRTLVLNAIAWVSKVEVPEKGVPSKENPVARSKK